MVSFLKLRRQCGVSHEDNCIWLCRVLIVADRIFELWSCIIWTLSCSMWDLVPQPGREARPPVLGAWSLSHWTTKKVPKSSLLTVPYQRFFKVKNCDRKGGGKPGKVTYAQYSVLLWTVIQRRATTNSVVLSGGWLYNRLGFSVKEEIPAALEPLRAMF